MVNFIRLTTTSILLLFLNGCKSEVVAPLNYSEIGSGKTIVAEGQTEITSCNEIKLVDGDFVDTGRQSDSLVEFRQKLSFIFPFAKFKGCIKKDFTSFASFSVPFELVRGVENERAEIPTLRVEGETVFVDIPRQSGADLDRELTQQFSAVSYSDISLTISFTNDSGRDLAGEFYSLHIDGIPIVASNITIPEDVTVPITLSSVALEAIAKGRAPYFMRFK